MRVAKRVLLGLVLLGGSAHAYETDQLTRRHEPLPDVTALANAGLDRMLGEAVARTNRRTGCEASTERTRRVLAREIFRATSRSTPVRDRGWPRSLGFGTYAAWMETTLPRRSFDDRGDVFSDLTAWESLILRVAGPSSTFLVADVLMGSDKPDHFLSEGYRYYQRSRDGRRPDRARAYGTATERSVYGMLTSKTFSWADLAANQDGYEFYTGLLTSGSILRRGDDGCVVQTAPFDWADWATWEYDEVLNPSTHTRLAQRGIDRRLHAHRDAYCESYAAWGGPGYQAHIDEITAVQPEYVHGATPPRDDPYELATLCADAPHAHEAGAPRRRELRRGFRRSRRDGSP